MGYTNHCWVSTDCDLSEEAWAALCRGWRAMADECVKSGVCVLAGGCGDGAPAIDDQHISFNGQGDESHETCVVHRNTKKLPKIRGRRFAFVKTNQKPYDTMVLATYALWKHVLVHLADADDSDIELVSDGGNEVYCAGDVQRLVAAGVEALDEAPPPKGAVSASALQQLSPVSADGGASSGGDKATNKKRQAAPDVKDKPTAATKQPRN
eukprot:m.74833 g.74833  ORF g.74833 m.74833 type:complete len:210 (-) comp14457_c0_seq2:137-766(-)